MAGSVARAPATTQGARVTKALRIFGGAAHFGWGDVVPEALVGGGAEGVGRGPHREVDGRDEVGLDEVGELGRLAALEGGRVPGALGEDPAEAVELALVEAGADPAGV